VTTRGAPRGEPWGEPASAPADVRIAGGDAEIADVVGSHPTALVELDPDGGSDIARAVGVAGRPSTGTTELSLDVIDLDDDLLAVNAAVLGVPPDRLRRRDRRRPVTVRVDGQTRFEGRATTVVIATGQYLRGADLAPRGHPGDGRVEVQVYALDPLQRRRMRRRLATGTHVPHPGIVEATGRSVEVTAPVLWPLEVDGCPRTALRGLTATVRAHGWRLLV
jgi:hypothetical protein